MYRVNKNYSDTDIFFGLELEMCVCDKLPDELRMCCPDNSNNTDCCKNNDNYIEFFTKKFNFFTGYITKYVDEDYDIEDYFRWYVTRDVTVSCKNTCREGEEYHPLELISPILEYNTEGNELIAHTINVLNENFNFEINKTQGLHINISYLNQNIDDPLILRFLEVWYYFEPTILSFLPDWRLETINKFANPLRKIFDNIQDLRSSYKKFYKSSRLYTKYSAVNVKPDRFEIRIVPPSMDLDHIQKWIELLCNLLYCSITKDYIDDDLFSFILPINANEDQIKTNYELKKFFKA